jgi:hypothetical protein
MTNCHSGFFQSMFIEVGKEDDGEEVLATKEAMVGQGRKLPQWLKMVFRSHNWES